MTPRYANVMSTVAVFIALGGTSYAVTKLPKNSVGSEQVKDSSLQRKDLSAAALGVRGPRGPQGIAGTNGANGTAGATGGRGPSDVVVRRREGVAAVGFGAGNSVEVATMNVPAGRWLLSAETNLTYFPNTSPNADSFHCGLVVDGTLGSLKTGFMGNATGAAHVLVFVTSQAIDSGQAFKVVLRCWHDAALPSGGSVPGFDHTLLSATRTESLDAQDVTG
jgi:hypothetical protein